MADANLFSAYLRPPKSVAEYGNEMDAREQNQLQLAASRLGMQDDQAMRKAYMQSGGDQAKALQLLQQGGQYKGAQALQKSMLDTQKTQADIGLSNAHAGNFGAQTAASELETRIKKSDQAIKDIASFNSPDEAIASIQQHAKIGDIAPDKAQMILQGMPQNPADFPKWQLGMLRGIMTAKDQMALSVPDANAQLSSTTSLATNKLTNETSRANNAATQAGENARSGQSRATQLQIAGIQPNGQPDANMEMTAQAIAKGQLPAPTGMALLNPKNQRILGRVMEINPQYDFTDVTAKKAAATAFTSGAQGNALRSVSTANAHLDQLGTMVDALNNGNTQVVNKVSNWYKTQTGQSAPTDFNGIKNIIGQEVVKAIVANGGGVSERDAAAQSFSSANSPAQLKSLIQHYRMVMGAQQANLLEQRRAAGLSDSTLPKYNNTAQPEAPGGVPADIADLLKKHGGK